MDLIIVRQATLNDLDILQEFEQGVINAERPFDATIKDEPINYYDIKELIASPHIEIVVAEINKQVIACGYARIQIARSIFKYEKYAYLGFMYVHPQHRGKGVVSKIIDHLKAWSKEQDLTELRLEVYTENIAAVKAYEKIGFLNLVTEMRMPVN